jgi:general secretion pathway protein N
MKAMNKPPSNGLSFGGVFIGCVVGALLALVYFAPARWLSSLVGRMSGGAVQLVRANGTIWDGRSHLMIKMPMQKNPYIFPDSIEWNIGFSWQGVNCTLRAEDYLASDELIALNWHWNGFSANFSDNRISLPSEMFSDFPFPWNKLQRAIGAQMTLDQFSIQHSGEKMYYSGRLWLDIQMSESWLSNKKTPEDYRIYVKTGTRLNIGLPIKISGLVQDTARRPSDQITGRITQ